jgi:glycerol-3-phosphate dehydrogenase
MNIALIMSAVKLGATVANKVEVTQLLKDVDGKVEGARVRDNLTGEEWEVKARVLYPVLSEVTSIDAYLTVRA